MITGRYAIYALIGWILILFAMLVGLIILLAISYYGFGWYPPEDIIRSYLAATYWFSGFGGAVIAQRWMLEEEEVVD